MNRSLNTTQFEIGVPEVPNPNLWHGYIGPTQTLIRRAPRQDGGGGARACRRVASGQRAQRAPEPSAEVRDRSEDQRLADIARTAAAGLDRRNRRRGSFGNFSAPAAGTKAACRRFLTEQRRRNCRARCHIGCELDQARAAKASARDRAIGTVSVARAAGRARLPGRASQAHRDRRGRRRPLDQRHGNDDRRLCGEPSAGRAALRSCEAQAVTSSLVREALGVAGCSAIQARQAFSRRRGEVTFRRVVGSD